MCLSGLNLYNKDHFFPLRSQGLSQLSGSIRLRMKTLRENITRPINFIATNNARLSESTSHIIRMSPMKNRETVPVVAKLIFAISLLIALKKTDNDIATVPIKVAVARSSARVLSAIVNPPCWH